MLNKNAASGKGHFGDLTDDLLWHVLSFLPVADALQTCVLDTRWRDHWRRTTSLPLIFDQLSFPSSERFKQLVKLFIHLRGNSPLDKCKIVGYVDDEEECTYTNTMLLIQYALKCQVKELLLSFAVERDDDIEYNPLILDVPLISQHLKTLHLKWVYLKRSTLNFSRCSVLEELEMQQCNIDARRISSKSLKHLYITNFCSFPAEFHIRIFAPGLISLQLDDHHGLTPYLEYMPSLETAYVWLDHDCYHSCRINRQDCEYDHCSCHAYPVEEGVLLHGLSNAVNLELLGNTYTELKFVGATGAQEKIEQSFVCSHLEVVNIECGKVDEGVHKILKFLSTCGIRRDQISIVEQWPSYRFSF
ncbi:hypothetical protein VPH35_118986 [Triticum aestivum]|uniref:F-box domain-containing protein n=1 Tax=Triticum aestivum TaxID=4565 RepID=A0A3B6QMG0_WHEAT